MVSSVVLFTPRIGCILIQKHDIRAEDVFSAIPDLRAFVKETLVAMSRRRLQHLPCTAASMFVYTDL
jgi:hypothetical protein